MILENVVHFIGALLKHIIGVLLLCWRRMLRAGLIAFFIGVVLTVLVGVIGTGQAIPSPAMLILALLLGSALAYGVALTVLVEEMILGAVDLIRILEGDIQAGAHIAEVVAEREVGEVGQGLRRLIGLPVTRRGPTRPGASLPQLFRSTERPAPSRAAADAVAAGAATSVAAMGVAALSRASRSAAPQVEPETETDISAGRTPAGEPVPADRLPRISWTYEHEAVRPPKPDTPTATSPSTGTGSFTPAPALAPSGTPAAYAPPPPNEVTPQPAPVAVSAPATPEPAYAPGPEPVAPPAEAESPATQATTPIADATALVANVMEPVAEAATPDASPHIPFNVHQAAGALSALADIAGGIVAARAAGMFTHHDAPVETPVATPEAISAAPAPSRAAETEMAYEDERLAAPASIATPEGPAEPAERVDEPDSEEPDAPVVTPAEPPASGATLASDSAHTAPLTQTEPAAEPWPDPEPPATPAPATTPLPREAADTRPIPALAPTPPSEPTAAAEAAPTEAVASTPIEPATVAEEPSATAPVVEEPPAAEPAARSEVARRTLPLGGGAPFDGARPRVPSAPRASAPESGLWERLSSALIQRAGAPSGPFASAPQAGGEEPSTSAPETEPEQPAQ
ncbi:MAG TPA: hypothetical protein VF808_19055 [Ktedonobacterales bacterium]